MNSITDIAGDKLSEHLKASWLNHQAIANNLANANTPAYRGSHIAFKDRATLADTLADIELQRSQPAHLKPMEWLPAQGFEVTPIDSVQVDQEMAEMNKNSLFYQTLVEVVARQDKMARSVIEGR